MVIQFQVVIPEIIYIQGTLNRISIYISTHLHRYVIKEKEAIRGSKMGYRKWMGGRKEKGEMTLLYLNFKIEIIHI